MSRLFFYNRLLYLTVLLFFFQCGQSQPKQTSQVITGAEQTIEYLDMIQGKRVALVVNQTSMIGKRHLLDTLIDLNLEIVKVFAPEHGFRGNAPNGTTIHDGRDVATGTPILSLYGKNKKPSQQQLEDVDVVIFDIQDVGARFYTYISTMHYLMEACAEYGVQLIILDRPNPNGYLVDGPILEDGFQSFVGMHCIPVLHGLTVGELAQMIIGENWLESNASLDLKIVTIKNWDHNTPYSLPVPPSPNLPNDQSVALYPSLCLFEGTSISVGRGTEMPFQVYGAPFPQLGAFTFKPVSVPHASKYPVHENELCYGKDLRESKRPKKLDLRYLLQTYHSYPDSSKFFNDFFDVLAGTASLRTQITNGYTLDQIENSWLPGLTEYKRMRKKYLLYAD